MTGVDIVGELFSKRALWVWQFRFFAYWLLVAVTVWIFYMFFGLMPVTEFIGVFAAAFHGDFSRVSTQNFATSLAVTLGAFAFGFFFASLICHCILVRLAIHGARSTVELATSKADFAARYDAISRRLEENPLLGPAWGGFAGTLVASDTVIRSTLRPNVFVQSWRGARAHLWLESHADHSRLLRRAGATFHLHRIGARLVRGGGRNEGSAHGRWRRGASHAGRARKIA